MSDRNNTAASDGGFARLGRVVLVLLGLLCWAVTVLLLVSNRAIMLRLFSETTDRLAIGVPLSPAMQAMDSVAEVMQLYWYLLLLPSLVVAAVLVAMCVLVGSAWMSRLARWFAVLSFAAVAATALFLHVCLWTQALELFPHIKGTTATESAAPPEEQ